jgi:alpha-methylacyl-CoA racemase
LPSISGAIEPQFYAELLRILKASVPTVPSGCPPHPSTEGQHERDGWPQLRQYFTAIFAQRTRAEWTASFIDTDACTVPVLDRDEALIGDAPGSQGSSYVLPRITKNAEMVSEGEEPVPPAPAPRLSATPARIVPGSAVALEAEGGDGEGAQLLMTPGEHTIDVLKEWIGASDAQIKQLYQERAIGANDVPEEWERSSKL